MRPCLIAIALAAASVATHAQHLEFKGVPFGATKEEFNRAHPSFFCKANEPTCSANETRQTPLTYGGEAVQRIEAMFSPSGGLDGLLIRISPKTYESLAGAIESKYGPASSARKGTVKNRMGAEFEQEERRWILPDGQRIRMARYAGSLDHGYLMLYTTDFEDRVVRRKLDKADSAKSDM